MFDKLMKKMSYKRRNGSWNKEEIIYDIKFVVIISISTAGMIYLLNK
jgi:hypothetical protein